MFAENFHIQKLLFCFRHRRSASSACVRVTQSCACTSSLSNQPKKNKQKQKKQQRTTFSLTIFFFSFVLRRGAQRIVLYVYTQTARRRRRPALSQLGRSSSCHTAARRCSAQPSYAPPCWRPCCCSSFLVCTPHPPPLRGAPPRRARARADERHTG